MVLLLDKSRQLIEKQLENLTKFFDKYHIDSWQWKKDLTKLVQIILFLWVHRFR